MLKRESRLATILWRLEIALIGALVCWQYVSSIIFGIRSIIGG
jgi:hypothetical protein